MRRTTVLPVVLLALAASGSVRAGPVEDARAVAKADRPAEAERLLEALLAKDSTDATAWVALGDVERQRCRLVLAEASYRRAVERDLGDPGARAGLAEVLLLQGRPVEALAQVHLALDAVPAGRPDETREDARPWRARALCYIELRRYDLAVASARRAVALAPSNSRCVEALGAALFRAGDIEGSRVWYERAVALEPRAEESNLRLGNGFGRGDDGRPWLEGEEGALFSAALDAWNARDLDMAGRRFLALTRKRPYAAKYRLGLGLVRLSIRRRNEAVLGGDPGSLYLAIPSPEVEGLRKVIRGYDALTAVEKRVVCVATAPARPVWAALVAAGATHDLLSVAADLTDEPLRRDLLGQRAFDGRRYEHLRGVGGPKGATGTEKLDEAAEFAFNTFAHEFGHQVHRMGLSAARQQEVDEMYASALAANRCLDYYAASNADEYFAQGYEAFVSPAKRGCLTETARHTRAELAERDPPLYEFLWRLLDTSFESPAAFASVRAAAKGPSDAHAEPAGR